MWDDCGPQAPSSINVALRLKKKLAQCSIPVIFLEGIPYSWYTKKMDVLDWSAVSMSVWLWTSGLWAVHLLDRTATTHSFVYTCSRGLSSTPQYTSNVGRRSMKPRFRCIHEHKHIQTGDGHRKLLWYSSTRMLLFCSHILYEASILWLICTTSIQWWSIVFSLTQGAANLIPFGSIL